MSMVAEVRLDPVTIDRTTFVLQSRSSGPMLRFRSDRRRDPAVQFWSGRFDHSLSPFLTRVLPHSDSSWILDDETSIVDRPTESFPGDLVGSIADRSALSVRYSEYRRVNRLWASLLSQSAPKGSSVILLGTDFLFVPSRIRRDRPDLSITMIDPVDGRITDVAEKLGIVTDLCDEIANADHLRFPSTKDEKWWADNYASASFGVVVARA